MRTLASAAFLKIEATQGSNKNTLENKKTFEKSVAQATRHFISHTSLKSKGHRHTTNVQGYIRGA